MPPRKKYPNLPYLMGDDPSHKRKPAPPRDDDDDDDEDDDAPWAEAGDEGPDNNDWGEEPDEDEEDDDWSPDEVPPPPAGDWPDDPSEDKNDEEGEGYHPDLSGQGDDDDDDDDDDDGEEDQDEDEDDPFGADPPASVPPRVEQLLDENELQVEDDDEDYFEEDNTPQGEPLRFVSTPEAYVEAMSLGLQAELEAGPTLLQRRGLDELLFRPAGLFSPRPETVDVSTQLGGGRPLHLSTPVLWSPMELGPLTALAARSLARAVEVSGSCLVCPLSLLPEVWPLTHRVWVEITPGGHWPDPDVLNQACGVVIGLGVIPRTLEKGEVPPVYDAASLAALTQDLRHRGIPLGVRLWAGALEQDLPPILAVEPDLLMLDGQGSTWGITPTWRREQLTLPLIYALPRISHLLATLTRRPQLVVSGGLRLPADVIRVHSLGADLALMSTAPVVAAGLWRVAGGGGFSRGGGFRESEGAFHLANFSAAFKREMEEILRGLGKSRWDEVRKGDIYSISEGISRALDLDRA